MTNRNSMRKFAAIMPSSLSLTIPNFSARKRRISRMPMRSANSESPFSVLIGYWHCSSVTTRFLNRWWMCSVLSVSFGIWNRVSIELCWKFSLFPHSVPLSAVNYETNGKLQTSSFCDYQFLPYSQDFLERNPYGSLLWRYFFSPRYPAKYPEQVKCSYEFIGR